MAFRNRIRFLLGWGIDFIQIREKDLPDRDLLQLTSDIVSLARSTECRILVNGRADIALAAGAHGVHLPSAGPRISDVRSWLPPRLVIGISAHSGAEAAAAESAGADYVLLGPVFRTPSKAIYGPPLGLAMFRAACRELSLPVLALGGISRGKVPLVLEAGAAGVAAIRMFQQGAETDLGTRRTLAKR